VIRLDISLPSSGAPQLLHTTLIATGFAEQLNSSALVLGPTGVALGRFGTLYVADTINNRIGVVPFAPVRPFPISGGGFTLTSGGGLNAPLGMAIAPNGDVITANGGDGNAVETTPWGQQVATVQMDPLNSGGDLFGLIISPNHQSILFVDDGDNTLKRFNPR
jgi:sugar lactone lactonase YvrE